MHPSLVEREMSTAQMIADWSAPRTGAAFTGYSGISGGDAAGGPSGTLLLAVSNTPMPCRLEGMAGNKSVQFTVLNVRKKGWIKAPW